MVWHNEKYAMSAKAMCLVISLQRKKERIKSESQKHGYKPGKFSIRIVKKDLGH